VPGLAVDDDVAHDGDDIAFNRLPFQHMVVVENLDAFAMTAEADVTLKGCRDRFFLAGLSGLVSSELEWWLARVKVSLSQTPGRCGLGSGRDGRRGVQAAKIGFHLIRGGSGGRSGRGC